MRRMCVGWMKSLKEEWLRVTVQKWCDTDVRGGGKEEIVGKEIWKG